MESIEFNMIRSNSMDKSTIVYHVLISEGKNKIWKFLKIILMQELNFHKMKLWREMRSKTRHEDYIPSVK